ncbi:MAG TPA: ABC transporter substrate-binding protein [Arthrobacter sp.]|nr:ABC transporter substrate-binding protein [Arthrobacter sp.]
MAFRMRRATTASWLVAVVALSTVAACGGGSTANTDQANDRTGSDEPTASITSGPADSSLSPVNILFFGSHTGQAAQYSIVVLPPEQLAVKHINEHEGGINGHPLHVKVVDAQLDPAKAVQLYHANSSDAVAIASIFSNEFAAIGPLAKSDKIPVVTEATAVDLIEKARPYVWSVSPNITSVSQSATDKWLSQVPSMKKIVVIEDKFDASYVAQTGAVEDELKKKGLDVAGIGFAKDTTNFAPLVARIKSDSPDGVVVGGTPAPAAAIVTELRRQNVDASILVTQGGYTGSFTKTAGDAATGIYAYTPLFLDVPEAQDFVSKFKPLAGGVTPPFAAGQCYEIFEVLAEALRTAHAESADSLDSTREAVQNALADVTITGVAQEKVSFGADGFSTGTGSLLKQNADGSASVVH